MTTHASLDPAAILAHLGVPGVAGIAAITEGADTALWRVAHAGGVSALRVLRAEQAGAAIREAAAMAAATAGGVPAPRIERQGVWRTDGGADGRAGEHEAGAGRPVFLLEWLFGYTVLAALLARPWRAEAIGRRFGRMQARIHALPAPPALRQQSERWLTAVADSEPALVAHLRALHPRTDALLHLDYHPLNVLLDGGRDFDPLVPVRRYGPVNGVLDWTNARAGDPRADYANTEALLTLTPGFGFLPPRKARAARYALVRGWRRGYRDLAGPLPDLAPFHAWAGASIYRDVAHRLGQPDTYVTPAYLTRLRRWTVHWKRRVGVE